MAILDTILDACVARINAIASPAIPVKATRPPLNWMAAAEVPSGYCWVESDRPTQGPDGKIRFEATIGIAVVGNTVAGGDSRITTLRAKIQNAFDVQPLASGTDEKGPLAGWEYYYAPGLDDTGRALAVTGVKAMWIAVRGAN